MTFVCICGPPCAISPRDCGTVCQNSQFLLVLTPSTTLVGRTFAWLRRCYRATTACLPRRPTPPATPPVSRLLKRACRTLIRLAYAWPARAAYLARAALYIAPAPPHDTGWRRQHRAAACHAYLVAPSAILPAGIADTTFSGILIPYSLIDSLLQHKGMWDSSLPPAGLMTNAYQHTSPSRTSGHFWHPLVWAMTRIHSTISLGLAWPSCLPHTRPWFKILALLVYCWAFFG